MTGAPQVSVAIISFQQKPYIGDALQSLVDQDYPDVQIVVSDDNSTDGTAEEIAKFAERYPDRILTVLNKDQVGITRNSNRALQACTGKYVCFLGGDDLFLPGKISRQVAWFEEREERVLCGHQVEVFYEDGSPSHRFQRRLGTGIGPGDIIRYGAFAACSIMVRASSIPPYGFDENLSLVSDYMLWIDVLAGGGEFGFVPGVYSRYRRHAGNVSGNNHAMADDAERALRLIEKRYPRYAEECRRARARFVEYPLGKDHLAHGRRKAAREAFLRAIRLEPGFPRPWEALMKSLITA